MKLGLQIGYSGANLQVPIEQIKLAEELGYDSVWSAEAYGSDAITVLAWIAAFTTRIRLGTGIMQLAGRSPAMAAMQAQTVDALAGGKRVIAGVGVSGPQIVEGWYGQPWGRPYWRLRDYIQIMRKVNRREGPVRHEGREISLPYAGEGSAGLGKPLMSILHTNVDLPIWCGAGSEATVKLAAELCDGWLPLGFVPGRMETFQPWIEEGFRRAGNGKSWENFEIQAGGRVVITDDVAGALSAAKAGVALYVGGMGHPTMNFHNNQMRQRGFPEAAERIQELFLAGRKQEAIDAVPDEYIDESGLYGSPQRITARWAAWEESGITGFTVSTDQDEALGLLIRLAKR
jgi:F420-dependent oxidoreductase-like protein